MLNKQFKKKIKMKRVRGFIIRGKKNTHKKLLQDGRVKYGAVQKTKYGEKCIVCFKHGFTIHSKIWKKFHPYHVKPLVGPIKQKCIRPQWTKF